MNACRPVIKAQKPSSNHDVAGFFIFKVVSKPKKPSEAGRKSFAGEMRRIRTNLFGRHQRPPAVQSTPEREPPMANHGAQNPHTAGRGECGPEDHKPKEQQTHPLPSADIESRLFALRHLSRALTTLAQGIRRLEHAGLYIEAFGLRNVWDRLLTDFVRSSDTVGYEPPAADFEVGRTHDQQLSGALDDIGMALVMAEATMARWEWVPLVLALRTEVTVLYERFGRRMPKADG